MLSPESGAVSFLNHSPGLDLIALLTVTRQPNGMLFCAQLCQNKARTPNMSGCECEPGAKRERDSAEPNRKGAAIGRRASRG